MLTNVYFPILNACVMLCAGTCFILFPVKVGLMAWRELLQYSPLNSSKLGSRPNSCLESENICKDGVIAYDLSIRFVIKHNKIVRL